MGRERRARTGGTQVSERGRGTLTDRSRTVDHVIADLDVIVERAREEGSRLGYFPALYRRVTAAVRDAIAAGEFDDGPRMERLDVAFADRYLAALEAHRSGDRPARSWAIALEAARERDLLILQHLLLAINAHINLDLAVAAASIGEARIDDLRGDFERITGILVRMIDRVQDDLATVSPWMGLLDWIGARDDEEFAAFSLSAARRQAWREAVRLANTPVGQRPEGIDGLDRRVALLARLLEGRGPLTRAAIWWVRRHEAADPRRVIDAIRAGD